MAYKRIHLIFLLSALAEAVSYASLLDKLAERVNGNAEKEWRWRQTVSLNDSSLDFDVEQVYLSLCMSQGDVHCLFLHLALEEICYWRTDFVDV